MDEKDKSLEVSGHKQFAEVPDLSVKDSLQKLVKFGGYKLLETTIEGAENMNPDRKVAKNMFLKGSSDADKAERTALKHKLEMMFKLVGESETAAEAIQSLEKQEQTTVNLINENLAVGLNESRTLESSYRSVAMFFRNANVNKVKNLSVMNATLDQVCDLNDTQFIDAVAHEFESKYDRLDLRENYSLLVIPGYLGNSTVLNKWAGIAHDNKVLLVTDFEDHDQPDMLMKRFEKANLTGGAAAKSHVIMTCNWLLGRTRSSRSGEEEDLFVPASAALAGKIYNSPMAQIAAGKKYGTLSDISGLRFQLKKAEIANLEKLGLIPLVKEFGEVMAYSGKTLFDGDDIGLQSYSIVRVFDWIGKVLMDLLNRRAFENFSVARKRELRTQIIKFLDEHKGNGKLIEDFDLKHLDKDPNNPTVVNIEIHLKPFFAAKTFNIKMDGTKGDDGVEWEMNVS